jgi:hypothetical protein
VSTLPISFGSLPQTCSCLQSLTVFVARLSLSQNTDLDPPPLNLLAVQDGGPVVKLPGKPSMSNPNNVQSNPGSSGSAAGGAHRSIQRLIT